MDLKAKYLLETCSDPIGFLNQLRQTTEPIGGACSSVLSMQYDVARMVAEKAMEYAKEQTKNKIWHDSNKEQPEYGSDVIVLQGRKGDVLDRVVKVNPDRIWAYTNDILSATLHDEK